MCQAAVYMKTKNGEEELMRDVTYLAETEDGILLETLFGEPKTVRARIGTVDLMKNIITLEPTEEA